MAFGIDEFVSNLDSQGVLRPCRFTMEITPPPFLTGKQINGLDGSMAALDICRSLALRGHSVVLPGVGLVTSQVFRYGIGPQQLQPFNATFTDTVRMQITVDEQAFLWFFFYDWINGIFNFAESSPESLPTYTLKYRQDIQVPIKLKMIDDYGDTAVEVNLVDAFPNFISDSPLDWNNNSQLMDVTVGFTMKRWFFTRGQTTATQTGGSPSPSQVGDFAPPSGVSTPGSTSVA